VKILAPIFERAAMVWFLLGLLFFSAGLYLGIDYTLSFAYLIVGCFCCAYGVAVYLFRLKEKKEASKDTRLSPNCISLGGRQSAPSVPQSNSEPPAERAATE
jgi:hypothetical protein